MSTAYKMHTVVTILVICMPFASR